MIFFSMASRAEFNAGQQAPEFELIDQYNKPHKISDYHGKWIVLYFYPKDDTAAAGTECTGSGYKYG